MIDGVQQCARYAFGPNRLHMCGPDANREVLAYLNEGVSDGGLTQLLTKFKTLYPYLETIAHANKIEDPFDPRVVEAYWLGNNLLDTITPQTFYRHLTDNLQLHTRLEPKDNQLINNKLINRPPMHHNFHVFNVWKRTGHMEEAHTLESMDQCRVSWGKVTAVDGPFITVLRSPLILSNRHPKVSQCHPTLDTGSRNIKQTKQCVISTEGRNPVGVASPNETSHVRSRWHFSFLDSRFHRNDNRLILAPPIQTKLARRLDDNSLMEDVAVGDWISIHWGMPCEILSLKQLKNLKRYTVQALALANITI